MQKNISEEGYSTKAVGIPNLLDKITRDMGLHLLIYFQKVLEIYICNLKHIQKTGQ